MKEKINKATGLTVHQEKATRLLMEGATFEDCANKLGIELPVLADWQAKPTFRAFANRLKSERQLYAGLRLLSLYDEAVTAISECLQS